MGLQRRSVVEGCPVVACSVLHGDSSRNSTEKGEKKTKRKKGNHNRKKGKLNKETKENQRKQRQGGSTKNPNILKIIKRERERKNVQKQTTTNGGFEGAFY